MTAALKTKTFFPQFYFIIAVVASQQNISLGFMSCCLWGVLSFLGFQQEQLCWVLLDDVQYHCHWELRYPLGSIFSICRIISTKFVK